MASKTTSAFARNYRTLERAAEKLRQTDVRNIDELLSTVELAIKAHRACSARLDAVQQMLGGADGQ